MRSYGGEDADQRRERRRTQLVEAAGALVHEVGAERLTVRGVCKLAHLNDRYFYESFGNTNDLLVDCFDRAFGETLVVLQASLRRPAPDVATRTRDTVTATLQHLIDHPHATSVMLAGRTNPILSERRGSLIDTVVRMFVAQAAATLGTPPTSPVAAHLTALTLVNGALETTCMWLTKDVDASKEVLIDHLTTAILSSMATIPTATA